MKVAEVIKLRGMLLHKISVAKTLDKSKKKLNSSKLNADGPSKTSKQECWRVAMYLIVTKLAPIAYYRF